MSDSVNKLAKVPFEVKPDQSMAIRTLPPMHAFQELSSINKDLLASTGIKISDVSSSEREYPNDDALKAKLSEIRFLPIDQLKVQFKSIIDSDNYDDVFKFASTFHERQRREILHVWSRIHNHDAPVKPEMYRHAVGGQKFVMDLLATPDEAKARKEFPEIPLRRRSEWLDIMLRTIAVTAAEPEALRLKKCLVSEHQPQGLHAVLRPCLSYGTDYQAAIDHYSEPRKWGQACHQDWISLSNNVIDTPDFDLAKSSYAKFASCIRGARIATGHRAHAFAQMNQKL